MENNQNYNNDNRLQELGGSDFEIVDNQPNIKGWTVKDAQGQTIGEVEELIFDAQARKVRYMVVDLEGNVLDLEPRDVLIPIGMAELHESDDDVMLPAVTADHLRALPLYEKGSITGEIESGISSVFSGLGAAAATAGAALTGNRSDDTYDPALFNQDNLYRNRPASTEGTNADGAKIQIVEESLQVGKREVETGSVHVSTRVVEEEVEKTIPLREEHVVVTRTPVDRPITPADVDALKTGDIEMTERKEIPVVSKDGRVVEEVTIGKVVTEHDETIRDTVRRTELNVDDQSSAANRPRTDASDRTEEQNS
jgi:uncharacterized protein (TIGR02271 family)